MDLRRFNLSLAQAGKATQLLSYQPFIITDDVHTGVAHSWLYRVEGGRQSGPHEWVCDRRAVSPDYWSQFVDANGRLRNMYEDWLDDIARRFPGCSLLDVGCNSGYFPVAAELKGMRGCAGYDHQGFGPSVDFLNRTAGTRARFYPQLYDFYKHCLPGCKDASYDVVVASLLICHLPDPLHFLACLGRIARKAVFLFTGMGETDDFAVYYNHPNKFNKDRPFPFGFDNDTGLSRGLLYKSMEWMGFKEMVELPHRETWLSRQWFSCQKALLFLR